MKKRVAVILIIFLLTVALFLMGYLIWRSEQREDNIPFDGEVVILGSDYSALPEEISHSDDDNNGSCDICGVSVIVSVDLFALNDLHGKFYDSSSQEGVDELTTYLKGMYETEDYVILLSTGDMWQGSSESNLTKGHIITDWMNELDFVSMTIGNHEYDWGEEYISENAELAEFPFLAINIYDRETDERVSYCQSSILIQCGGARVGIIGAIGDCYSSISGEMSKDVYFKTGSELTGLVKSESEKLRNAGADFIIYSVHDGHDRSQSGLGAITDKQLKEYYDASLSAGYVDIVFEGHTHKNYVLIDSHGVYHLQNGGDNKGISHAEAVINFANGENSVHGAEYVPVRSYENMSDDPIVNTLMGKYSDFVSVGDAVLGYNASVRNSKYLCNLVAQLYLELGVEAFGQDYDIVLGGGYLSTRSPYDLKAGDVTYSQLQTLFPFDNTIVLCSIKGSDLITRFINSQDNRYFVHYSEYGSTVKEKIDPNGTYYVIVDTYTSTYAPNRLSEIIRYTEGIYARDILAQYIEDGNLS